MIKNLSSLPLQLNILKNLTDEKLAGLKYLHRLYLHSREARTVLNGKDQINNQELINHGIKVEVER